MTEKKKPQLIVALDVDSLGKVRDLVDGLKDSVDIFKVGSQLFTACGPAAVRFIEARGKKVFLDLKFHDIPNTVANAVRSAVGLSVALDRSTDFFNRKQPRQEGLLMYTVHTEGGLTMMAAAAEAASNAAREIGVTPPLGLGVTVLTSEEKKDNISDLVLLKAALAKEAGLKGVVASCHEAPLIRKKFGPEFVIVTPGIRPAGTDVQDQKRVATPAWAARQGSDYLVVGRPIVEAPDPLAAARRILEEIASSC